MRRETASGAEGSVSPLKLAVISPAELVEAHTYGLNAMSGFGLN